MTTTSVPAGRRTRAARLYHGIMRHWQLYLLMLLPIIWVIMFRYVPIWGSQIAFKDYKLALGVEGSPWAEPVFKHFIKFFKSNQFSRLMINTVGLSLYNILAGIFPPIILAIALNYCSSRFFSKTVQLVTYMPYFISTVLVVSILTQMLSLSGAVNKLIEAMGGTPIQFLSKPEWFKTLYVFSELWQKTGYNAVVYIAALAAISPELHEAAIVDGANIWQRILHVDIPGIMPTMITLTILACGRILTMGYEKVLLMQNLQNMRASDVISTYVYRIGIAEGMQFSYSTAIGLFQSVVSLLMLTLVNGISRKVSDSSLW
ncbi:MAG: ABC transporter permease [Aristaeellaceae bacterium]